MIKETTLGHDAVQGQRLQRILGRNPLRNDDGSTSFDELCLILAEIYISINVDIDTDKLILVYNRHSSMSRNDVEWKEIHFLHNYIDRDIGWSWKGKNYLGYEDLVAFSFSGIEPSIIMMGMAAKINIYASIKQ